MADSKHISFGEGIPAEMRGTDFAMISMPAGPERPLGFKLALPKDWKEVPVTAAKAEVSVTASFAVSNDVDIAVLETRIPFEINLVDWLEYQCHLRKFTLGNLTTAHAQNGAEVHAVAVAAAGDFLRMVICGDGGLVLWLVGRCTAPLAVEYEETLGLAAASIRILAWSGVDTREPLKTYRDPSAGFVLLFPESWQPERPANSPAGRAAVDFRLVEGRQAIAYLRVEADFNLEPGEMSFRRLLNRSLAAIEDAGIRVRSTEPVPLAPDPARVEKRWVGVCEMPGGPGRLALLFRRASDRWLAAIMIAPGKDTNPMAWMRAKRFFEIAVASLRAGK